MSVEAHRREAPGRLGFAAITVSDSRRTAADDVSGRRVGELAEAAGHRVAAVDRVPDETGAIRRAVDAALAHPEVDVVVLTGGTGFSGRDVTVEAVAPRFERTVEGFGELFRMLSHRQVGSAAMLSRAVAGVAAGRAVFLLPGSPRAVELAMTELILPEASHLVALLRRDPPARDAAAG